MPKYKEVQRVSVSNKKPEENICSQLSDQWVGQDILNIKSRGKKKHQKNV